MITRLLTVVVLSLALMLAGCSRSPEDAKKDLSKMNIQYNEQGFVKAADDNNLEAVKLFLEAGMSANTITEEGTPLMAAAANGNGEMAKLLIEKGANVNAKTKEDLNAILAAILGEGKAAGRQEVIKILLDKNVDLNVRFISDGVGFTPLMMAVQQKDIEIVKMLLTHKADVNVSDVNTGLTPLMLAAMNDNIEMAKELLSKGADVTRVSKNKATALTFAASNNNTEMIKVLKNAGAK